MNDLDLVVHNPCLPMKASLDTWVFVCESLHRGEVLCYSCLCQNLDIVNKWLQSITWTVVVMALLINYWQLEIKVWHLPKTNWIPRTLGFIVHWSHIPQIINGMREFASIICPRAAQFSNNHMIPSLPTSLIFISSYYRKRSTPTSTTTPASTSTPTSTSINSQKESVRPGNAMIGLWLTGAFNQLDCRYVVTGLCD